MWYLTHEKILVDLAKMHKIQVTPTADGTFFVCGSAGDEKTPLTACLSEREADEELLRIAHSLSVVNDYVPRESRFESGRKDA